MEEDDDEEGSGVRVLWVLVPRDGSANGFCWWRRWWRFLFFFFFFSVVVGGGEWMWRCLFAVIFFSFFVSGGCGMGRYAGGVLRKRETEERETRERGKIKNY